MSNTVASCDFSSGPVTAAAAGMLLAASPAALAIPPFKKVLLEICCPNVDLLSGERGRQFSCFLIFARKEPAYGFRLQNFLFSERLFLRFVLHSNSARFRC
jgi:hypothetical protein